MSPHETLWAMMMGTKVDLVPKVDDDESTKSSYQQKNDRPVR